MPHKILFVQARGSARSAARVLPRAAQRPTCPSASRPATRCTPPARTRSSPWTRCARAPRAVAVHVHALCCGSRCRCARAAAHASEHATRCAALAERAGAHAVPREGHCVHTAGRLGGRRRADVQARGLRAQGTRRVRGVRHVCAIAVAACVCSLCHHAQAMLRGASTAASLARCGPRLHAPPRRAAHAAAPPGRCARCCR